MNLSTRIGKSPIPPGDSTGSKGDSHRKRRLRRGGRQLREILPVAPEKQRYAKAHCEDQSLSEAHRESVLHTLGLVGELRLRAAVPGNQHVEPPGAKPVAYKQLGDHIRKAPVPVTVFELFDDCPGIVNLYREGKGTTMIRRAEKHPGLFFCPFEGKAIYNDTPPLRTHYQINNITLPDFSQRRERS